MWYIECYRKYYGKLYVKIKEVNYDESTPYKLDIYDPIRTRN